MTPDTHISDERLRDLRDTAQRRHQFDQLGPWTDYIRAIDELLARRSPAIPAAGERGCFAIANKNAEERVKPFGHALEIAERMRAPAETLSQRMAERGIAAKPPRANFSDDTASGEVCGCGMGDASAGFHADWCPLSIKPDCPPAEPAVGRALFDAESRDLMHHQTGAVVHLAPEAKRDEAREQLEAVSNDRDAAVRWLDIERNLTANLRKEVEQRDALLVGARDVFKAAWFSLPETQRQAVERWLAALQPASAPS